MVRYRSVNENFEACLGGSDKGRVVRLISRDKLSTK